MVDECLTFFRHARKYVYKKNDNVKYPNLHTHFLRVCEG